MKLYEMKGEILALLEKLEPDQETGELPTNYDELLEELQQLNDDRNERLQWVAKSVLNVRAQTDAIDTEIKRLQAKKKSLVNQENGLMYVLDRECGGQKTDLGVATVSYRKSESVSVDDEAAAIMWLMNNSEGCIKYTAPTINKTEVKRLLKQHQIPGVSIVQSISCSLK